MLARKLEKDASVQLVNDAIRCAMDFVLQNLNKGYLRLLNALEIALNKNRPFYRDYASVDFKGLSVLFIARSGSFCPLIVFLPISFFLFYLSWLLTDAIPDHVHRIPPQMQRVKGILMQ